MQAGGGGQVRQDAHNLRQLRGWLRAWASGQKLQGSNSAQSFSIELSGVSTILAISVTSDPTADVVILDAGAPLSPLVDERLMAVVSLPETLLLELAHLGGAAIDLVDFVLRITAEGGRASRLTAIAYLREQRSTSIERAKSDRRVSDERDTDLDDWVHKTLVTGIREAVVPNRGETDFSPFAIMSDLDWQDNATLSLFSADTFRKVRDVALGAQGPMIWGGELDLNTYKFFVVACDLSLQTKYGSTFAETLKSFSEEHEDSPVIAVQWFIFGRPIVEYAAPMFTFFQVPSYDTQTSLALREVRSLARWVAT